jgi:hypothetical protein
MKGPGVGIEKGERISIQALYDFREKYEFCSGQDLSKFFEETVGDPSPSGEGEIDARKTYDFVYSCAKAIRHNANGEKDGWFAEVIAELKKTFGDFGDPED